MEFLKRNSYPLVLFIVIITVKLYYLFQFPLLVDEVFSYLYFIEPGPFIAITDYREPNNHVFFSFFCSLLKSISLKGVFMMRIVSMIAYLILLLFLYQVTLRKFGKVSALLALAFQGFFLSAGSFGILGRGYMFMALFGNTSIVLCYLYYNASKPSRYFLLFTASNILGFFTIPSYLLVAFSLYAYSFFKVVRGTEVKKEGMYLATSIVLTACIVGLLYLPIVLVSGSDALFHNRWLVPSSFSNLVSTLPITVAETIVFVSGVSQVKVFVLVCCLLVGLMCIKKWTTKAVNDWMILMLFVFIVPLILILVKSKHPPYRTFYYLSFPLFTTLAIIIALYIERLKGEVVKQVVCALLILCSLGLGIYQFNQSLHSDLIYGTSRSYYDKLKEQRRLIVSAHPKSIFVNSPDDFLDIYLRYDLIDDPAVTISNQLKGSPDFIIMYNEEFPTALNRKEYRLVDETNEVKIYQKM